MSKSLAVLAFESLCSKLKSSSRARLADISQSLGESQTYPSKAPLFITWNKNNTLRGCIGTFSSVEIESGVAEYALISAFEDSRFPPIKESELDKLSVSVTLLANFEPIDDCQDWEIGVHGLKVQIQANGRFYSGTFLPSVAEEQEWNKTETLWYLLRKAGYNGVSEKETTQFYSQLMSSGKINLTRYEGLKCGMDYKEYVTLKSKIV
ncbi:hypothetical protein EJF18_50456 [Clavispora lusitaniae]|uniref:AMMECR1 domain-containing protein n=2 Tax=Clavispora lusitaniae TaxID=36911 RepID=C4Y844_CLAL4|nr:uncharacterized protein CLUG_04372 [Clavispora lusitaniae ATCC 42720]KAF7581813.1 AMMECR1 family protein [Clavispora lusitaniae]EEQ40244.1 hypothetical protein CLUG_04372 [Clavispora lusitaniae ATCC 42720]QFZ29226.1 hypothetical protein EJF14_50456 [Clavispora lusitaniae]QFZ34889.1 hypothetical protein EJF16_50456 [Clavispora lusitaniae]QFZ40574.1 hypothetical protein EJF15_50456 [Clavispora lusitaniae]